MRRYSWLLCGVMVFSVPLSGQSPENPVRTIPLPAGCQHPFRELYEYNEGRRLGLQASVGFCRIIISNGSVREFAEGRIESVTPSPKGRSVAIVNRSYRIAVQDDEGRSQFDGQLESTELAAIYWSSDESHVIILSIPGEDVEVEAATIIDLPQKKMKTIRFGPPALVRFDVKTDTIRAEQEGGTTRKVLVYGLNGQLLRRVIPSKTQRERIVSANRKYSYIPKHEIGEGDTLIQRGSTGPTVLRLPERKKRGSRQGALWDNPEWNPVNDDLLLALYLSEDTEKEGRLNEIDVFSVSQKKIIRVFPQAGDHTPAYGWSADGKQVILCDVSCSFYTIP